MRRFRTLALSSTFGLIISALLLGQVGTTPPPASISANRYLAHLSTDKPIYRANERVYLRGAVLTAADHLPMDRDNLPAQLQITGPKGDTLFTTNGQIQDSVAAFNWDVPADAAGGQYTATISFPW